METSETFQYNTLGALMAGLYGGSFTIGELLNTEIWELGRLIYWWRVDRIRW